MTLQEIYDFAYQKARSNAQENCAFDLSCLLESVFGISRFALLLHGDQSASPAQQACFELLAARYLAGEPLQYLLGEWSFFGLSFSVGPGVLIPRPDTETLVEVCLALLRESNSPAIADLCAGSGCISISIAHNRPDAVVYALELSTEAFSYLERNIQHNHSSVQALSCDVLSPPALPLLDLVVSNPPYLSTKEMDSLQLQVTHEPTMALAGGEDGYDFYRLIPSVWYAQIKSGGWLAFEVGYTQADTVATLMRAQGFLNVQLHKDLCGIDRVVTGQKQ